MKIIFFPTFSNFIKSQSDPQDDRRVKLWVATLCLILCFPLHKYKYREKNSREHMKQDILLKVSPDIHDYVNYLARFGVFMTKNIFGQFLS